MSKTPSTVTGEMNPWGRLPACAPFVLPEDLEAAAAQQRDLSKLFKTGLMPEPYFGLPNAMLVVLLLNPGYDPRDDAVHAMPEFRTAVSGCLAHVDTPYPFIHLKPDGIQSPGREWWMKIAHRLIKATDLQTVSRRMMCLEFMPYKSKWYQDRSLRLPSQTYTFHLLREALKRNAFVLVMRSEEVWYSAVPELGRYENKAFGKNYRRPYLSPGNFEPGVFDKAVQILKGAT